VNEKDLQIAMNQGVLSIAGERKAEAPEGYVVHRRERGAMRFSRAFNLPVPVEVEKTSAIMQDGVLTITLPKSPEAQPRKIDISSR
jgi:HSP20 family protein